MIMSSHHNQYFMSVPYTRCVMNIPVIKLFIYFAVLSVVGGRGLNMHDRTNREDRGMLDLITGLLHLDGRVTGMSCVP